MRNPIHTPHVLVLALLLALTPLALPALAQRPMEYLTRGLVAVHPGDGKVFLSWRLLGTDLAALPVNTYLGGGIGTGTSLRLAA